MKLIFIEEPSRGKKENAPIKIINNKTFEQSNILYISSIFIARLRPMFNAYEKVSGRPLLASRPRLLIVGKNREKFYDHSDETVESDI